MIVPSAVAVDINRFYLNMEFCSQTSNHISSDNSHKAYTQEPIVRYINFNISKILLVDLKFEIIKFKLMS